MTKVIKSLKTVKKMMSYYLPVTRRTEPRSTCWIMLSFGRRRVKDKLLIPIGETLIPKLKSVMKSADLSHFFL